MNQVNEASKSRLLKTLAVFGFVALIILGTWLAIQVVRLVPSAFSSLASLAESVEEGREAQNNIDIAVSSGVINSNESFTIAWSDLNRDGNYVLAYDCIEGVSLDIRIGNDITSVACGASFVLPKDTYALDAQFSSQKNRFTDIPYQISFIKAGASTPFVTTEKVATVINANIPEGAGTDSVAMTDDTMTDDSMTEEPAVEEPVVTTPSTPVKPSTYTVTNFVKPVSDPNGFTELEVKYLGVGVLKGNEFIPRGELDSNDNAAFQFQVKNIGTKTSGNWTFEADLTSGADFTSKTQQPLKPNERTILTIAFGNAGDDGLQEFGVEIDGGNDRSSNNNSFTWAVHVND